LPNFYRQSSWERCFSLEIDGCSLHTFFLKCKDYDTTVILVKDEHGYKFGGFCREEWRCVHRFFGNGENLLFTFRDGDDPEVF